MNEDRTISRSPSLAVWVLAYLFSAASFPFLCLRRARAIGNLECLLGFLCGLLVHIGPIPVLAKTEGNPMQIFVLLTTMLSLYLMVMWQYLAGRKASLWSEGALKQWRTAGIFFAGFIAFALAGAVAMVQLGSLTAGSPPSTP